MVCRIHNGDKSKEVGGKTYTLTPRSLEDEDHVNPPESRTPGVDWFEEPVDDGILLESLAEEPAVEDKAPQEDDVDTEIKNQHLKAMLGENCLGRSLFANCSWLIPLCFPGLLLLLYPSLCNRILLVFHCELIDGNWYLVEDVAEQCFTAQWAPYGALAVIALFCFPLGFPVWILCVLQRNAHKLHQTRFQNRYGFVYLAYAPGMHFGELMECLRKFVLVGAVVFFFPGTSAQVALGLVIAYFFMLYQMNMKPFSDGIVNHMQTIALTAITMTLFCGLALKGLKCSGDGDTGYFFFVEGLLVVTVFGSAAWMLVKIIQYLEKARMETISAKKALVAWQQVGVRKAWRHLRAICRGDEVGHGAFDVPEMELRTLQLDLDYNDEDDVPLDHGAGISMEVASRAQIKSHELDDHHIPRERRIVYNSKFERYDPDGCA